MAVTDVAAGLASLRQLSQGTAVQVTVERAGRSLPLALDGAVANGESAGFRADGRKIAGGRLDPNPPGILGKFLRRTIGLKGDPFGGDQGGQGRLFGDTYEPYSVRDHFLEVFSGPHDWLSNNWYSNVTGNLVRMNWFYHQLFSLQSTIALVPATAIAGANIAPGMIYVRD